MSELSDLVLRWQAGWGHIRGYPPAATVNGALRFDINLPRRAVEYIALEDQLGQLLPTLRMMREPTWVTVPTYNREQITNVMIDAGLSIRSPEWLMIRNLADHESPDPVDGYLTNLWLDDDVMVAEIATSEDLAAKGSMTLIDDTAVADQIWTDERHRRRGLGRLLMGLLTQAARHKGARTGVLIASEDGRALYRALGWSTVCDVVVAATTPA